MKRTGKLSMKTVKQIKEEASACLKGKRSMQAATQLVCTAFWAAACCALCFPAPAAAALLLFSGPLALGLANISLDLTCWNDLKVSDLFCGFRRFSSALSAALVNGVYVLLWSLLLVVPGIIKMYSYAMTFFILAEEPNIGAAAARRRSVQLMRGNRLKLFRLTLGFAGWVALCVLTFGILWLWVLPYMRVSTACFYKSVKRAA